MRPFSWVDGWWWVVIFLFMINFFSQIEIKNFYFYDVDYLLCKGHFHKHWDQFRLTKLSQTTNSLLKFSFYRLMYAIIFILFILLIYIGVIGGYLGCSAVVVLHLLLADFI